MLTADLTLSKDPLCNITELKIISCHTVDNEALIVIFDRFPRLESFQLLQCPRVTVDILAEAVLRCPLLKHIDYHGSPWMTNDFIAKVKLNKSVENLLHQLCPRLVTCKVDCLSLFDDVEVDN